MKNRILMICCTRGRPERAKEMYRSVLNTASLVDVVFCVDYDDECRKKRQYDWASDFVVGCGQTTTELINNVFKANQDYAYYSITNDDVVYETDGWDKELMNKGKISYGNDQCQGENMPTISVIDGDICRSVGWLQMPKLVHLYGDCVWRALGQSLDILDYHGDIITNHKHFMYNKKIEKDETYKKTNSADQYREDAQAFEVWVRNKMQEDVVKIRSVL